MFIFIHDIDWNIKNRFIKYIVQLIEDKLKRNDFNIITYLAIAFLLPLDSKPRKKIKKLFQ